MSKEQAVAVVVEDEWLLRLEVADALAQAGWDVIELATGEQALFWLEQGGQPRLLITDIRLPGLVMGWDVAERFRGRYPKIAVVYCSANPPDRQRQVPGSFFFAKPVRMDVVINACGAPS
ncbi:MAG TPA: response regulator [Rhizomicrobium sp.]|nr:response regulator [Rhizomicrobium sp.]